MNREETDGSQSHGGLDFQRIHAFMRGVIEEEFPKGLLSYIMQSCQVPDLTGYVFTGIFSRNQPTYIIPGIKREVLQLYSL